MDFAQATLQSSKLLVSSKLNSHLTLPHQYPCLTFALTIVFALSTLALETLRATGSGFEHAVAPFSRLTNNRMKIKSNSCASCGLRLRSCFVRRPSAKCHRQLREHGGTAFGCDGLICSTDGTHFYYAIPSEVHAHNHRRCALHCTQLTVL